MYIHNFYSDLLLSVKVLFDTYIFRKEDYVYRYEFNIGNRTFQMPSNYQTNFVFPTIIVTLNDESPSYGQRPEVSQNIAGFNIDQTPVLYDITNENILYVQEEMVNIPITAVINCESQLQAKEVANVVKRWLPINKFLQTVEFTSFLEVSEPFLNGINFNPNTDQISNLYTKWNHRTGQINYCFSMQYFPFIRLESVSTAIPDSTQRSFQVNVDLTYMIQFPLFLYSDQLPGTIEKIDISIVNTSGFEPISDYPSSKIINHTSSDIVNLKKGFIRRNYVIYEDDGSSANILTLDTVVLPVGTVTAESTRLEITRSADDSVLISIDGSESRYKITEANIPVTPDSINVTVTDDEYLTLSKNLAGNITTILHKSMENLTVKFDPNDFLITTDYSYNLFSGNTILKDYEEYTLDLSNNSVIFTFTSSNWLTYKPTITHPLIIQFYNKIGTFPFQFGGVAPNFANIKAIVKSTTAKITWTSGVPTTTYVEYGLTTSYGSETELKEDYVNTHQSIMYNLTPFKTYHYRIVTTDEDDIEYISNDYSFTTNP